MQVRLCCLRRTLCCLQRPKGYVLGWCLGNNPPFVFCGIRLIGLPALSGRDLISACLPFPLAGRPFHRFHQASSTPSRAHHGHTRRWTFRFCSVAKALAFPPKGGAILHVGGVSSDPSQFSGSESHTPTRQPTRLSASASNKNFHKPISIHEQTRHPCHRHTMRRKNHPLPPTY